MGDRDRLPSTARRTGNGFRVVITALLGNLAIAVTKFIAFATTGSSAMLTESIHSLVDTSDQGLLLLGQWRARRPTDDQHPFGYGMEIYFWSFVVALILFLTGGLVAVWEGYEKLLRPQAIQHAYLNYAVIAIAAFFEGFSFRVAYREYRNTVRDRNTHLLAYVKGSKDPNIFAVLLEDGAALTGLAIAAAGIFASTMFGLEWADGASSIAIGFLLIAVALFLANETRSLIAGEAASPAIRERMRAILKGSALPGALIDFKTLHLGPASILVAIEWKFPATRPAFVLDQDKRALTDQLQQAEPRIHHVLFGAPAEFERTSDLSVDPSRQSASTSAK